MADSGALARYFLRNLSTLCSASFTPIIISFIPLIIPHIITGISFCATCFNVLSRRRALAVLDRLFYFRSITATVASDINGAKGIVSLSLICCKTKQIKEYNDARIKLRKMIYKMWYPKERVKAPKSLASPRPEIRPVRINTSKDRLRISNENPPLPIERAATKSVSSSGIWRVLISSLEMRNKNIKINVFPIYLKLWLLFYFH